MTHLPGLKTTAPFFPGLKNWSAITSRSGFLGANTTQFWLRRMVSLSGSGKLSVHPFHFAIKAPYNIPFKSTAPIWTGMWSTASRMSWCWFQHSSHYWTSFHVHAPNLPWLSLATWQRAGLQQQQLLHCKLHMLLGYAHCVQWDTWHVQLCNPWICFADAQLGACTSRHIPANGLQALAYVLVLLMGLWHSLPLNLNGLSVDFLWGLRSHGVLHDFQYMGHQ